MHLVGPHEKVVSDVPREQYTTSQLLPHAPPAHVPLASSMAGTADLLSSRTALCANEYAGTSPEPEEFFTGVVEEVGDEEVLLRTVASSTGEEASATLPLERIPESERQYIQTGVPIRIAVLRSGGTVQHRIRFLRPAQWKPPEEQRERVASWLLEQMKAVLHAG